VVRKKNNNNRVDFLPWINHDKSTGEGCEIPRHGDHQSHMGTKILNETLKNHGEDNFNLTMVYDTFN
jgi:hypothetical protein